MFPLKRCTRVTVKLLFVNVIQFTIDSNHFTLNIHKLIAKGSQFNEMNIGLLRHVKSILQ
jgi:hypothetical protein